MLQLRFAFNSRVMNGKFLIVVAGPTAIGKTSLAIKIAKHFKCEIISCDSRQFYREMKIGTAVPSDEELQAAKHHFIHHRSVHHLYTVGDFEKDAITKLDELFTVNDFAVLVGGSGLYVDAVLKGFDNFPDVSDEVRTKVRYQYETEGISYLQNELKIADPEYFNSVDIANPQRMMRALEVSISSGKPYSGFLRQNNVSRNFAPVKIGLEASRDIIYERINIRVDQMINEGLVEEARSLYEFKDLNALQTVGYRELFDYFDGKTNLETAISEIKKNTRRFAKRQLTWFRRDEHIKWFDISDSSDLVFEPIADYISNRRKLQ